MILRSACYAAAAVVVLTSGAWAAPAVTGDYLEVRSLNIYAGACHYEGEYVTAGREAVLAWNFRDGAVEGVSLAGVRAVAVVVGQDNLAVDGAKRRSVLYLDAATPAQRQAAETLLRERASGVLGEVAAVRNAALTFAKEENVYHVALPGELELKVREGVGDLCCIQPPQRWYDPFLPVSGSNLGYSLSAGFQEPLLEASWSDIWMNNAFYGQFRY